MTADKIKYALPGEEQRKEMAIITACWDQMSKLDTYGRYRVVNWLSSWVRSEEPKGETHDFDSDF